MPLKSTTKENFPLWVIPSSTPPVSSQVQHLIQMNGKPLDRRSERILERVWREHDLWKKMILREVREIDDIGGCESRQNKNGVSNAQDLERTLGELVDRLYIRPAAPWIKSVQVGAEEISFVPVDSAAMQLWFSLSLRMSIKRSFSNGIKWVRTGWPGVVSLFVLWWR